MFILPTSMSAFPDTTSIIKAIFALQLILTLRYITLYLLPYLSSAVCIKPFSKYQSDQVFKSSFENFAFSSI